ncbi:hypothetical protein V6Z12_A11G227400 [Gossypium hirsutum]
MEGEFKLGSIERSSQQWIGNYGDRRENPRRRMFPLIAIVSPLHQRSENKQRKFSPIFRVLHL